MTGGLLFWKGDRQCDRRASARIGRRRSGRRAVIFLLARFLAVVAGSAAPAAVIEADSATVIDGEAIDLGPVMAGRRRKKPHPVLDRTAFFIRGAKIEPANAGK